MACDAVSRLFVVRDLFYNQSVRARQGMHPHRIKRVSLFVFDMQVKPGTKPGQKLSLKGKGEVPRVNGQLGVACAFRDKSLKAYLSSEPS
ncbi:hypothetical protein Tco_0201292 [Tanacetum coccineum]